VLATPILQFFAVIALLVLGQKDWNKLVAALSDLASSLFEAHRVPEADHGLLPCQRMEID
jgi:hypothetical protein